MIRVSLASIPTRLTQNSSLSQMASQLLPSAVDHVSRQIRITLSSFSQSHQRETQMGHSRCMATLNMMFMITCHYSEQRRRYSSASSIYGLWLVSLSSWLGLSCRVAVALVTPPRHAKPRDAKGWLFVIIVLLINCSLTKCRFLTIVIRAVRTRRAKDDGPRLLKRGK